MNIPMHKKSPIRLKDMAASMGRNVRQPHRLQQSMGSTMQQPGQSMPARAFGQAANRPRANPPFGQAANQPRANQPFGQAANQPRANQPFGQAANQPRENRPMQGCQPGRTRPVGQMPPPLTGVKLQKGQKVPLAQSGQPLSQLEVSIGWNAKNPACDLDASAFLLAGNNKVVGDAWFVFYGQQRSPDGSVVHHGDSKGGAGESLTIDWKVMDANVKKIVFTITINEALERHLNFGMVANAYIQVRSPATGKGILHFELEEYYSNVTSMMVGEIYERNGEWKFHAIGNGVARDLAGLCEFYGVEVSG